MAQAIKNVLELSTDRKRQQIKIDGKSYPMLDWDELPVTEGLKAQRVVRVLMPDEITKLNDSEAEETIADLADIVSLLLPEAPQEILGKLAYSQHSAIVGVARKSSEDFLEELARMRANGTNKPSAQSSSVSTGAGRKTGKK